MTTAKTAASTRHHIATHSHVLLSLVGDLDPFVQMLHDVPGVGAVTRHGNHLDLEVDEAQPVIQRLVELATSCDVQIVALLVSPDAFEAGGLEAELLAELSGIRGEGELG